MIISKTCQIATRALIALALVENEQFTSVSKLGNQLGTGVAFLTKILQPLTQNGILVSIKGTRGGVKLKRSAKDISMEEIVSIYDGNDLFDTCALGIPSCTAETPCAYHYKWAPIRDQIHKAFAGTSIEDLAHSLLLNDSPLS